MSFRYISPLYLLFSILAYHSYSQSIVGRWEGIMADEILQVNIVQKGKMLCGYSYDFRIDNPADRCKAYFTGAYDANEKLWRLKGYRFIENSGSHVLMSINLRYIKEKGKIFLRGYVIPKSSLGSPQLSIDKVNIELTKEFISKNELNSISKICFPEDEAPNVPAAKRNQKTNPPAASNEKKSEPEKLPAPEKKEIKKTEMDTKEPSLLKEPKLPFDVSSRKRNEVSTIRVNTRNIKLKVFDNGIVDNDTVTIYYNKRLLISRQKLSEKPIEIDLELDEKETIHEIVMFAENLGSIPPNTALIVVNAGDKRYELFSSASMEENAVLVFEYQPPLK